MDKYFNYHMHSTYSNASTTDSVTNIECLIKRAIELGQDSFCVTEHGNMLSKYETSFLCKKYKIKQIVGAEFYFVKDRLKETESDTIDKKTKLPTRIKDRTNSHIIMIAKNRNGYEQLNTISSWANIDGFYGKPRIDLDLINKYINENDVIITTACCAGFVAKYGIDIIKEFQRFIDVGNFYLEFQVHNTEKQIEYNKIILDYSQTHNIPTTIACDTHIITEEDELYRTLLLRRKKMVYDSEENWYLDFPSWEELAYRAEMQNVIPHNLIMESLENTNSIASQCEQYDITEYSLKIPVPLQYKNISLEERTEIFKNIVYMELEKYMESDEYARNNKQLYLDTIAYELGEIIGCNTQDYFLLNYELIKRGKELGGVLTKTSRGSASCFLVNMLLGFTAMDRLQFNLPLLPERFLTKERILSAKTPPDIDMNMAEPAPFYQACKELLGEEYCYPMIAFGKVQEKTGWKIYAATNGVPIDKANAVSKAIDEYMVAKKYADEDAEIDIEDYIPEEHMEHFNNSKKFRSVIENIKQHACGYLVSPTNIIKEIGLIRCKDVICAGIEGSMADKLGYVKNDFLVVSCVDIIDKIYKRIGIEQPNPQELLKLVNDKVWDIYELGLTFEVNQFTANRTKKYMETYKPRSIEDLSSAVAFIRPGCSSIVDRLVKRENFSFGVKEIDDILFNHTGIGSYVLYQESIMEMLSYAGIDKKETYTVLKAISKKKEDIINASKESFINGIINKMGNEVIKSRAEKIAHEIWTVIIDASAYSFNSPHSLSVSLDSLYVAYLKVNYPTETYCTLMDYYSIGKKRKISKTAECKRELERIGEKVFPIKLGYVSDVSEKTEDGYVQSVLSAKGVSANLAKYLKQFGEDAHPLDVYFSFKESRMEDGRSYGDKRNLTGLCEMGFFSEKYSDKKVVKYAPILYDSIYSKKQFRDSSLLKLKEELKIDFDIEPYLSRKTAKTYYLDESKKLDLCKYIFDLLPNEEYTITEKAINEVKRFGYLVNSNTYKEYKIFDGMIKRINIKDKSIIITSHTSGIELKVYMKNLNGIKKKTNILILGAQVRAGKVYANNFISYT